jgi:uncharacterized heparinase superfamily protein
VAGQSAAEEEFLSDLHLHSRFVRANLEQDVGGNHLVKNIKALIGAGVFLGDEAAINRGRRLLARQQRVQILADGGHFERSPSYHCQVLGDLLDVAALLAAADLPPVPGLDGAIRAMRGWLGAMMLPDGDIPLFNDCVRIGAERVQALGPRAPGRERLQVLEPSGYVVARPSPALHLVADVGPPCPPELPAHAHADCLSFELAIGGHRTLVNSGTSTYEPGPRRQHERSTVAHNTLTVDMQNQTEVWGTFRAARRAVCRVDKAEDTGGQVVIAAGHDGYRRLPGRPRHTRVWRLTGGTVRIRDVVTGEGTHHSVVRLHVAPGIEVLELGDGHYYIGRLSVTITAGDVQQEVAQVATEFGPPLSSTVIAGHRVGPLPHEIETTVVIDAPRNAHAAVAPARRAAESSPDGDEGDP